MSVLILEIIVLSIQLQVRHVFNPGLDDPSAGRILTARDGGVACSRERGLLAPGIVSVYLLPS